MSRSALLLVVPALIFSALPGSSVGAQPLAKVACEAWDNGSRASARFTAFEGGKEIGSGVCGRDLEVAPGAYELLILPDGVLGSEGQRLPVEARVGKVARAKASFETAELLVEITRDGRRSVGMVQLLKGSDELARLGAGVASRLAVGSYSIEVESRGERRRIDGITLARGERRVVGVAYGAPPK